MFYVTYYRIVIDMYVYISYWWKHIIDEYWTQISKQKLKNQHEILIKIQQVISNDIQKPISMKTAGP